MREKIEKVIDEQIRPGLQMDGGDIEVVDVGDDGIVLNTKNGGVATYFKQQDFDGLIPLDFNLRQNYPNPFNPTTTIEFDLPTSSQVTVKIFNVLGEEVTTLLSASLHSGSHSFEWDASNLASGVYLYRLEADGYVQTRKMLLIR